MLGRDVILKCCVTRSARPLVMKEAHVGDVDGGNFVADITIRRIFNIGIWWKTIHRDVKDFCKHFDKGLEDQLVLHSATNKHSTIENIYDVGIGLCWTIQEGYTKEE